MGFKKSEVPEELPDLDLGEEPVAEQASPKKTDAARNTAPPQQPQQQNILQENENGFFQELLQKLESEDPSSLEDLKNPSTDLLTEMKDYWARQDTSLMGPGRELKQQLLEKIHQMRQLEKEWQEAYYYLIEKEEHIKTEEESLKQLLAEFVKVYKRQKKSR